MKKIAIITPITNVMAGFMLVIDFRFSIRYANNIKLAIKNTAIT